jgi:hypothetical protein
MFDRIPMDIIHVPVEVSVVSDQVLPESALPDTTLALIEPTLRNPFGLRDSSGEPAFYQGPSYREIRIAGRKRPNTMKMVG